MGNEIKKIFNKFIVDGFIFKKENKAFTWIKRESIRTSRIVLPYLDAYPNCIKLQPITVEIYFDEIENLYNNLVSENTELNQFGKSGTVYKKFW